MIQYALMYLSLGALAGFLAGLLGVGGGLVVVPVLTFVFTAQHFPPEYVLHLALGTSLASILFTSVSSVRAHHARGAVMWSIVTRIMPGIVFGTLVGTVVAARLSSHFLKVFFIVFIYYVAVQMFANIKPKPSRQLPGTGGMFAAGNVIGGISSLVGIGGGTISVPFMTWCNVPMHSAIGTSAALGFPIAAAGAIGYLVNGLAAAGLPSGSIGFIYLPALLGIVVASMATAPLGARTSHRLPVAKLKRAFALLLLVIGTRMLVSLF